jgi:hypothetical protein
MFYRVYETKTKKAGVFKTTQQRCKQAETFCRDFE